MEMIETIFFCLPNAFKGTIYRVGKMPDLVVERITSGVIDEDRKSISWGLPSQSVYNYPDVHGFITGMNPDARSKPWDGVLRDKRAGPQKIH